MFLQVGLVSDKKLLELLDFALSANTTNTVRCLRELLDSGVDALSLVAQLASLITNILAGTSDVHSEMKGFSKRNFCMPISLSLSLCNPCGGGSLVLLVSCGNGIFEQRLNNWTLLNL